MVLEKNIIEARAKRLGFSFIAFAQPRQTPHFSDFLTYISTREVGDLAFLNKQYVLAGREKPQTLLKDAASVIILGVSYPPPEKLARQGPRSCGRIAAYALLPDYHRLVKEKAMQLLADLEEINATKVNARIFVDSGPVMEKDMAFASGVTWIGKNTLSLHPEFGSYFLLACIFTDITLKINAKPAPDLCGDCLQCESACPTRCIENHTIDIPSCVSYLTIEHHGVIPRSFRSAIGNRLFGCDTCQSVCPVNKRTKEAEFTFFSPSDRLVEQYLNLSQELDLTEEQFSRKYLGTPVVRIGFQRYLRNIVIAAGNSRNPDCIHGLQKVLCGSSELTAIHAAWALNQFQDPDVEMFLNVQLGTDLKETVRREIIETGRL